MSLIQEALRRKAKETGQLPIELTPEYPVEPAAPPPRRGRAKRRKVRATSGGLLVLGLLAAAGTVFFYLRHPRAESRATAPGASRVKTATTQSVESMQREPPAQAIRPLESMTEQPPEPTVPPEQPAQLVSEAMSASVEPPPAIEPKTVSWPSLRLQGVLTRGAARQRSAAFINAEMVEEGEQIEGVVLVEVGSAGVWLEFSGERKFLRVGQALP